MQIKIASALLLVAVSSVSRGDMGKRVEKLNESVKNFGGWIEECSTCYAASAGLSGDNGSLMKSCVEAICSNKEFSLAATLDKIYDGTTKQNLTYDNEIQPIINAISREDAYNTVTRGPAYLAWLKNPPDLRSSGAIRVFNLFTILKGGRSGVEVSNFRRTIGDIYQRWFTGFRCAIARA